MMEVDTAEETPTWLSIITKTKRFSVDIQNVNLSVPRADASNGTTSSRASASSSSNERLHSSLKTHEIITSSPRVPKKNKRLRSLISTTPPQLKTRFVDNDLDGSTSTSSQESSSSTSSPGPVILGSNNLTATAKANEETEMMMINNYSSSSTRRPSRTETELRSGVFELTIGSGGSNSHLNRIPSFHSSSSSSSASSRESVIKVTQQSQQQNHFIHEDEPQDLSMKPKITRITTYPSADNDIDCVQDLSMKNKPNECVTTSLLPLSLVASKPALTFTYLTNPNINTNNTNGRNNNQPQLKKNQEEKLNLSSQEEDESRLNLLKEKDEGNLIIDEEDVVRNNDVPVPSKSIKQEDIKPSDNNGTVLNGNNKIISKSTADAAGSSFVGNASLIPAEISQAGKIKLKRGRKRKDEDSVVVKNFDCFLCSFTCVRDSVLKNHMMRMHTVKGNRGNVKCTVCAYACPTLDELRSHQELIHGQESAKLEGNVNGAGGSDAMKVAYHACTHCTKKFRSQSQLEAHLRLIAQKQHWKDLKLKPTSTNTSQL